jgi:hypothetical protein
VTGILVRATTQIPIVPVDIGNRSAFMRGITSVRSAVERFIGWLRGADTLAYDGETGVVVVVVIPANP